MELYFAGGSSKNVEDFLWDNNCCRLFSQFREKRNILKYIERGGTNLFVDSGAFSAYNSGVDVDIEAYCEFANTISSSCKFIACLDVIGNAEESFANFQYMRKKLKEPNKLIPTFHINEPIEYLYKYLQYSDEYGKLDKLALGGIAKETPSNRKKFLDMCEPICEQYPDVWIHLFGVTDLPLIQSYSFIDSVDSTKYLKEPIYGHIVVPPKYKAVSIGSLTANKVLVENQDIEVIERVCSKIGFTKKDLVEYDWARSIFCIYVMLEWLEIYNKQLTRFPIRKRRLF